MCIRDRLPSSPRLATRGRDMRQLGLDPLAGRQSQEQPLHVDGLLRWLGAAASSAQAGARTEGAEGWEARLSG
eukprot:6016675-Pyramimonas_sp.AAC.1